MQEKNPSENWKSLWNEKGRVVRSRNSEVISVELEMLRLVCY